MGKGMVCVRRIWYALGAVAVLALAVAAATGAVTVPALGLRSTGAVIPVPPPTGAKRSAKPVAPFETIGSPYLQTQVESYRAQMTPQEVHDYYTKRLTALGYRWSGSGSSCGPSGYCASDWAFQLGQYTTFVLTVQPLGQSASLYSAAVERIVLPPRPAVSVVPRNVQSLRIAFRASASSAWISRTFTAPKDWKPIRRIVNGLPVDGRDTHGCALDFGARATLLFRAGAGTYAFSENPACTSVIGPGPVSLMDVNTLWNAIVKVLGVKNPYHH